MTEPIIYSRNYLDSQTVIGGAGNWANQEKLFDGNSETQFTSVDADDDDVDVALYIQFYEGGVLQDRYIDTLIFLNHNILEFTSFYWNGTGYSELVDDDDISDEDSFFSFTGVTTREVLIVLKKTQTVDQEKLIGELFLCEKTDFSKEMVSYTIGSRTKAVETLLADGTLHRSIIRDAGNKSEKYESKVVFDYLTQAEIDDLIALKESGENFLWQPESISRPELVYNVQWCGVLRYGYSNIYKGAGFRIEMDLREI